MQETPDAYYGVEKDSVWYYHNNPYTTSASLTTFIYNDAACTASKFMLICAAIIYTYQISSSNSDYCYYGATAPSTGHTATVTGTYDNRASTTVYYKINPKTHYYCNDPAYYNGVPYSSSMTGSSCQFNDQSKIASGQKNCSLLSYKVSGGTSAHGSVSWTTGYVTYNYGATWTITADSGYTRPTSYTGSIVVTDVNFTISDANRAAISSKVFDPCTPNDYDLTLTVNTGIDRLYYKVNGASDYSYTTTSTTVKAKMDSVVYVYGTAKTGYNTPNYHSGNVYQAIMGTSGLTPSITTSLKIYTLTASVFGSSYMKA